MRVMRRALLLSLVMAGAATPVAAQVAPPPRVLIDIGGSWAGGGSLGSTDATYITPSGATMTLFSTSQSVSGGAGLGGHLRVRLTPRVAVEASASWSRPELRSRITGDFESAEETTATQTFSEFLAGGGLVMSFKRESRWRPFARGAVSWMRQLSGDQSHYHDGVRADLGGGMEYVWREKRGHIKPYGLRADVWIGVKRGGLELDQKSRIISPGFSASLIFKL